MIIFVMNLYFRKSTFTSLSHLYEFVKTKIYFIVIHQQQIEGLFNKLDLKTHPNMTIDLKESKLRLTATNLAKENLKDVLKDSLKEIRSQRKKSREVLSEIQDNQLNEIQASQLFKKMFEK